MSEPKNNIDFVHLTNTQKDTILRLEKEIQELRNGQQGACYACEPVGELNKELEKEIQELKEKLEKAITILTRYRSDFSVQEFLKELEVNNE